MSRQKADEPYVQQKISLPATLMARFAMLHFDHVLQKTKYGAVSAVLTILLADYVAKMEAGVPALPEGTKLDA